VSVQHVVPNLPAGHASPAAAAYAAAAAAAAVPASSLDASYQRLHAAAAATMTAQPTPLVLAASPPTDLQQTVAAQSKDLLQLTAGSPAVTDTLLQPVRHPRSQGHGS